MNKPADNQFPIHDLLRNRWSPRAFSSRPVENEKVASLFEAARWSPSGANHQPWSFLFVTQEEPEVFARLLATLAERNQKWAHAVPMLILALARRLKDDGTVNPWAHYDLGQSVAHLSVEAASLGLFVHQMAGFDAEAARREFSVPDEYEPVIVVAVGYAGEPEDLPEDFRERELAKRSRKEMSEFVFEHAWNRPYRDPVPTLRGSEAASRT